MEVPVTNQQKRFQEFADSIGLDLETVANTFYELEVDLEFILTSDFIQNTYTAYFYQPISDGNLSITNYVQNLNENIKQAVKECKEKHLNCVIIDINTSIKPLRSFWLNGSHKISNTNNKFYKLHTLHNNYKKQYLSENEWKNKIN